jgi:predicted ATPase/serine phosphatase RsbU (regulator of sigma subunit)/tRNA A-37 threonylcarbamoyl transferase component Bud32
MNSTIDIGGYQLIQQIHESTNSLIYQAIRQPDQQVVILKILKQEYPQPTELIHYRQEYELTRSLNLEGTIQVYALEETAKNCALVVEDFGGISLKQWLKSRATHSPALTLAEFLPIGIQIAEILGQVHVANVIHKDINPANILINLETGKIKLIDFGIASVFSRESPILKNPNVLEGTLAYISPEQTGRMNRSLDYRTDFYSLGITFYELLTGNLPFVTRDDLALIHCHLAKQATPPHELAPSHHRDAVPPMLSAIVIKLMAKTAEERYQSAWGLKADLEICWQQLQATGTIEVFELGTQDISDRFQIPQKLYGREAEVAALLAGFDRVNQSTTLTGSGAELTLVVGYSGMGKSALVAEIHKPITKAHGYFISGKFEQFQRNIPYSALVAAFQDLIRQLLSETETQLQQWREQLLAALGTNGQIIADVIPQIELIIGRQPPVPELGAIELQNRFNLVFSNFIQAFCAPEHPLVIFLDDLQWADSATLKLMELILCDSETQNLFLIGSYRENEVSPTHPLLLLRETLRQEQVQITEVFLTPLTLAQIGQLIAETLRVPRDRVQSLAELTLQKTEGNPFFVNEFLKTLYTENLLSFDSTTLSWQWDIAQIDRVGITNNVVELMIGKLRKLPETTQRILCLAACMGAEFNLDALSRICDKPAREVFLDLKQALQIGLIASASELDAQLLIQHYRFEHDRIQQATYSLTSELEKQQTHLRIGRLLWQSTPTEGLSEKVFELVDHLNLGSSLMIEATEREQVAQLNLLAGQKAKAATAYEAAVQYLQLGRDLLDSQPWEQQYDLTLKLHEAAVEAEYLRANFEPAEQLAEVILHQAKTRLDRATAYELKVRLYTAQNLPIKALETGLQAVELLGTQLVTEVPETIALPSLEDIETFAEMTDAAQLSAMRILMAICPSAYFARPEALMSIVLTMIDLTNRQGYSALAAYGYVWYAAISSAQGQIETGYHAGQLALKLVDQFHAQELKAKVINLFCVLVRHWKEPAHNSIATLQAGIQSGLDTGDNEYACYCIKDYCVSLFLTGRSLQEVETQMARSVEQLLKLKQEYSIYQTNIWRQVTANLRGQSELRSDLQGDYFNQAEILPRLEAANNRTLLCIVYLAKLNLAYVFGDYSQAKIHSASAADYLEAVMGFMYVAVHNFYTSLTLLADLDLDLDLDLADANADDRTQALQQVETNQAQMQRWAESAPANFQHKYHLVAAEQARVLNQPWQAAEHYEQAIEGAKAAGYLQEEALACELAAEFFLSRGMERIGRNYLQSAHYAYTCWQAQAKVQDLEQRYPQWLGATATTPTISTTKTNSKSSTSSSQALDLATVIKASQAISGEIVLEQLLRSLMKVLIENAGAQVGYLILESHGQLYIEAAGAIDSQQLTVLQSIPVDAEVTQSYLSRKIVQFVSRTRETVVLNNATQEGDFINDAYVQEHQPQSILCVPLIDQGQLVSIVYLENNLTIGAFTPDRVELLKILSAQAAVSIENARLYQTLEDKVAERTSQLAQANQEITDLNTRLAAENLNMSAELDVVKQLQQMVLPRRAELTAIAGLDIAGFMEPATKVGGDYYDVLQQDGRVQIGIGDVTGHGLESGVLMIMVQTAVRTLMALQEHDPVKILSTINQVIHQNVQRMGSTRNLTLSLLDYHDGQLRLSGQHEEVLVVRAQGRVERIDTIDLGFPVGMIDDISEFVAQVPIHLEPGDGVVLYTDGITEAESPSRQLYGLERLMAVVEQNWQRSAEEISQVVVADVRSHMGSRSMLDDITLVVLKQLV